jgi:hypothetical protein
MRIGSPKSIEGLHDASWPTEKRIGARLARGRLASSLGDHRCRRLGAGVDRFHLLDAFSKAEPVFVVEPFSAGWAVVLIVVTVGIGYFIGLAGAVLWNRLHTR